MRRFCLVTLFAITVCGDLARSQLQLLTLRESASLVETVPAVAAAQKRGECPNLSSDYESDKRLFFQVRAACGPRGGQLIDNYYVDRRNGLVTTWGDNPKPVADSTGAALARHLVRDARNRILSINEARCLALEAARAIPDWDRTGAAISVKPFGKINTLASSMQFTAVLVDSPPLKAVRILTVFLAEPNVRDDDTGLILASTGIGRLTSELLRLRTPSWLNDQEAGAVGIVAPQIATNLRYGCTLNTGGVFHSREATMSVSCGGAPVRGANVLVDLKTGGVASPESGNSLDSSETVRLAQQLLAQEQRRKIDLKRQVDQECHLE